MTGVLRRRRKAFAATVLPVGVVATLLALSLPVRYRSTATLRADAVALPEMSSEHSTRAAAEAWVRARASAVVSSMPAPLATGLEDEAERNSGTAAAATRALPWQDALEWELVEVGATASRAQEDSLATVVFRVGFRQTDPEVAHRVVQGVSEAFSRWVEPVEDLPQVADPGEGAEETLRAARAQVERIEEQLLAFGQTHMGVMPEHTSVNLQMAAQLRRDLQQLDTQIQALRTKKTGLEQRLQGVDPVVWVEEAPPPVVDTLPATPRMDLRRELLGAESPGIAPGSDPAVSTPAPRGGAEVAGGAALDGQRARLEEVKSQLAALQRILGPSHPEVLSLAGEVGRLAGRLRPAPAPDVPPKRSVPNPAYRDIQTQLSETVGQLQALQAGRAKLATQLRDYEQKLSRAPSVEREHRALLAEREEARRVVTELEERLENSRVAASTSNRTRVVRISVVEPASVPSRPEGPGRVLPLALAWVTALAVGAVVARIRDQLDDTVASAEQVARAAGVAVVATLPWAPDESCRRFERVRWARWALGGCVAALVFVLAMKLWGGAAEAFWGEMQGRLGLGAWL